MGAVAGVLRRERGRGIPPLCTCQVTLARVMLLPHVTCCCDPCSCAPQQGLQPPSRRELLFGFLGAGLGVLGSSAYYNSESPHARLPSVLPQP